VVPRVVVAPWQVHNPNGRLRVVSTKPMPGTRWIEVVTAAGCRLEVPRLAACCYACGEVLSLSGKGSRLAAQGALAVFGTCFLGRL